MNLKICPENLNVYCGYKIKILRGKYSNLSNSKKLNESILKDNSNIICIYLTVYHTQEKCLSKKYLPKIKKILVSFYKTRYRYSANHI